MIKFLSGSILFVALSAKSFNSFIKFSLSDEKVPDGWLYLEPYIDNYLFYVAAIIVSFIFRERKLVLLNIGFPILGILLLIPIVQIFLFLIYYYLTFRILYKKYMPN